MGRVAEGTVSPVCLRVREHRARIRQDLAAHNVAKAKDADRKRQARRALREQKERSELQRKERRFMQVYEAFSRRQLAMEEDARKWIQEKAANAAAAARDRAREAEAQAEAQRRREAWLARSREEAERRKVGRAFFRQKLAAACEAAARRRVAETAAEST